MPLPPGANPDPPDPTVPKSWCFPPNAFGAKEAPLRVWLPPANAPANASTNDRQDAALNWHGFRIAVTQHAIVKAVRTYKAGHGIKQRELADADERHLNPRNVWNTILTGRARMDLGDMLFLMERYPGVLPSTKHMEMLLQVATIATPTPRTWKEIDDTR